MRFEEALNYLYEKLPMFQRIGPPAFKKDLTNTLRLCKALGDPQRKFKSVHIAGTNGKGSSSHMLAAILQKSGYQTGLYTSPHLKSFTERIRINGKSISKDQVVSMVERFIPLIEEIEPSFFEVTVAMAFEYFASRQIDIAIMEVGLGGRLDSTNVILPEVSLITNISYDHQEMLGDTLEQIATEKAGIIKQGVPVVIGMSQSDLAHIFGKIAEDRNSPLYYATDRYQVDIVDSSLEYLACNLIDKQKQNSLKLRIGSPGLYQQKNLPGVICVIDILREKGFDISADNVRAGLKDFQRLTGFKGRWQVLSRNPLVIADVAHNEGGLHEVLAQLLKLDAGTFHFVLGVVKEKDLTKILPLFPQDARYYFCQAHVPRALDARLLAHEAGLYGLIGEAFQDVNEAYGKALLESRAGDIIFIGGSTFVVSEVNEI